MAYCGPMQAGEAWSLLSPPEIPRLFESSSNCICICFFVGDIQERDNRGIQCTEIVDTRLHLIQRNDIFYNASR